jgi:hypothetical protein
MITIELLETPQQFEKIMLRAIVEALNPAIRKALPAIKKRVSDITIDLFKSTPTYESLVDGRLSEEFGFVKGTGLNKANAVIDAVAQDINLFFKPLRVSGKTFIGGIRIGMLDASLRDILSLNEATFITPENGFPINWLDWLLIRGDQIIITDHRFSPFSNRGRSGGGIMIQGRGWKVPISHSGTKGDNWLTRTLDRSVDIIEDAYSKIIEQEVSKRVR